jgi:hypothetical protein
MDCASSEREFHPGDERIAHLEKPAGELGALSELDARGRVVVEEAVATSALLVVPSVWHYAQKDLQGGERGEHGLIVHRLSLAEGEEDAQVDFTGALDDDGKLERAASSRIGCRKGDGFVLNGEGGLAVDILPPIEGEARGERHDLGYLFEAHPGRFGCHRSP